MVYMGAKTKYAKDIVPILQEYIDKNNIQYYIEPFVGGANIIDKIKCANKFGYDKSYPLIALHQKARENMQEIPEHGTSEWWYNAKDIYRRHEGAPSIENEMPAWKIGAISFLASFSNGGFSRGYAKNKGDRDYYNEAYRNLKAQSEQPLYKDINFSWISDYKDINIPNNSLVYCDPPYMNTKPYGYKFEIGFNYEEYWEWVRQLSKNNIVICSEQTFPEDFKIIWTKSVKRTCGKDNNFAALEKLGMYEVK